jgi:hypothetical protein
MSELIFNHVIWESFDSNLRLPLACVFGFLDSVRDFDHQVDVGEVRVVRSDFGHGFIGCLLDFLLVALLDIFVQRTATLCDLAKVFVVGNVLGAHVTRGLLAFSREMAQEWTDHCTFLQCEHVILLHP